MLGIFAGVGFMDRRLRENPLWSVLVEVAKSLPLYPQHKAYVRDKILPREPEITPEELSKRLGIPLGEALVILSELRLNWSDVEEELRNSLPKPRYKKAALGGTFNEVHRGHLALILTGLKTGEKLVIGVTTDELARRMGKKHAVKAFRERVKNLEETLKKYGWRDRCEIVALEDPYGPAATDPELEALVASPFTYGRALEVNKIRRSRGLRELVIVLAPIVLAEDGGVISSTRIACGEITPEGRVKVRQHP